MRIGAYQFAISGDVNENYKEIEKAIYLAKHKDVQLPVMVCQDGFITSHSIENIELENDEEVKRYFKAKSEIYALAVSLGGTISAEHGVGIEKLAYLAISAGGTAVDYMKKVKEVFDPNKILNPGKIFKS